ncbi:hypothetical protein [Agromyces larvae]|uniref:Uncharacterized protein n=1 Tax=Agromyces larvae TaxID=2929802 RepID=A0ABY4C4L7_9MICO|nr:hypothetical protein [Agromyces larvae]UOE45914.1 hypothetical protein MTO99_09295 [Agromyces larvae]
MEQYIAWREEQVLEGRDYSLEAFREHVLSERRREALAAIYETTAPYVGAIAPADIVSDVHRIAIEALKEEA